MKEWLDLAKNAYEKARTRHDTATHIAEKLEAHVPTGERKSESPIEPDYRL